MTGILTNNFGMWWRKRITGTVAALEPLARERAALERLIATTDNAAVAELAKIRLRVVRFLDPRGEPASASVEPTEPTDAEIAAVVIDLPRTHSPVPSAHLVDVVAKVEALQRLQSANGSRYAGLENEISLPSDSREDAWTYKLTAVGTRSVSMATVFAGAVVGLVLFFMAVAGPTELYKAVQNHSSQSAIFASAGILAGWYLILRFFRATLRVRYSNDVVDQDGLFLGVQRIAWNAIAEVRITTVNRQVLFDAMTRAGRRVSLHLEKLVVSPLDKPRITQDEWVLMFVEFMRSRLQHPRLIVNDALLLQERQ